MKKLKSLGAAVLIGLLIGAAFWWAAAEVKDRKDPLNKSAAFVHKDAGTLYWLELASRKGKVEGKFYQRNIKEEIGEVPFMKVKDYSVTGEKTGKGYELKVNNGVDMTFDAWFSGADLIVKKQGEQGNKSYKAVDDEELDEYVKAIQEELQTAIDQSEEKEKDRLNKFFSDLESVYGYLYSADNGSFQLFIKIDEALRQGELTGSLLMMADTGNENNPYEETRYVLNGITDGHMVEFFTTVNGKAVKLEGNFHEATGFDLSFWTTDEKLSFHEVTEEEFNQKYKKFKTKAQR
ncbi:hypothetical protein [Siminovitchia sp. 179-K 8D1 HS]|uniref:hypothetical protein n=1 Tax=Siminovitchia sp. 179-K 8D1 HS TaxID=3142385 RepID=UPI0039A344E1